MTKRISARWLRSDFLRISCEENMLILSEKVVLIIQNVVSISLEPFEEHKLPKEDQKSRSQGDFYGVSKDCPGITLVIAHFSIALEGDMPNPAKKLKQNQGRIQDF